MYYIFYKISSAVFTARRYVYLVSYAIYFNMSTEFYLIIHNERTALQLHDLMVWDQMMRQNML